jgi:hypothetical protein
MKEVKLLDCQKGWRFVREGCGVQFIMSDYRPQLKKPFK